MKEQITFDNLPQAVGLLLKKFEDFENKFISKQIPESQEFNRIDKIYDVCKITGFSKSKIYKLTMTDKIPHSYTSTGRLIFFKNELVQWIENNTFRKPHNNNVLLNIVQSAARK